MTNFAAQTTVATKSWAYRCGVDDATNGVPAAMMFASPLQQAGYDAGYASIAPKTAPAPIIVPQLTRNADREYVRKTDNLCYEQQVKLIEAQQTRFDKMLAMTAAFLGPDAETDMIFMAA